RAAGLVGKKVKVRIERALDGAAYASLVGRKTAEGPITAESEAEKPTRKPPARRAEAVEEPVVEEEPEAVAEEAEAVAEEAEAPVEEETPKKKTRRGSRGGRG